MSIANEFQNLADYVAGFGRREEPIPPRTARVLASALLDMADKAKLLERVMFRADEFHDAD